MCQVSDYKVLAGAFEYEKKKVKRFCCWFLSLSYPNKKCKSTHYKC